MEKDFVEKFVADYEFRFDCGGCHVPTDAVRAMLTDFAYGLLDALPAPPKEEG